MKLPRDLSGRELAKRLGKSWGYRQVHQTGSHIILETDTPSPHRVAIPDHRALRVGTLNAIIRSVATHKAVDRERVLRG